MKVICPSPGCQKIFDIDPDDHGRRLTCSACGAVLSVDRDRLRVLNVSSTPQTGSQPKEAPTMSRTDEPYSPRPAVVHGAWSTLVLVIGAVLVILCWFLGLADGFSLEQARAELNGEEQALRRKSDLQRMTRENYEAQRRKIQNNRAAEKVDEARLKDLEIRLKDLEEEEQTQRNAELNWSNEKRSKQSDIDTAQARYWRSHYWFNYGIMAGLFVVIAGALGYQMPHQPLPRKIVGAVLLCGIVLYTLSAYLGGINLIFRSILR
jgi:hypothetical protein